MKTICGIMLLLLLFPRAVMSQGISVHSKTDSIVSLRSHAIPLPVGTMALPVVPASFYAQHLGFFCRQELKLQQLHAPVTFRIGSMDQCNYLEQKPGYR